MTGRRRTDTSTGDYFEHAEDRETVHQLMMPDPGVARSGSMDGREHPMNNEQGQDGPQKSTPWGFFLVLAAIVVVAIMYSVTIYLIDNKTPETVFGAMAASFTVIGTLVGTYFGVKAGLDGQDKLKQTLARAGDGSRERLQVGTEYNGDQRGRDQAAAERQRATRKLEELRQGKHEGRQEWDGEGV